MNKKSFFLGMATGVVVTFVVLFVIGLASSGSSNNDPINYLETPVSYEGKTETSVKVFQVLGHAALAHEISDKTFGWYNGNIVMILGENYYSDQIVKIKKPMRIGTYSYTTKSDMPKTVPVLDGEMK